MHLIKKRKYTFLVIFLASFFIGSFVSALTWDSFTLTVLDIFSSLMYLIVMFFGYLDEMVISIFINVIQYNNFLKEAPVLIGWVIIRDICNMGFVVILLIISISSILQIESYGYKNRLFKILIMAILINFSKMFTGLLIDASQYVMLEFAVGIKNIGAGNILYTLGINKILSIDYSDKFENYSNNNSDINIINLFITVLLAGIISFVAFIVMLALTVIIIIRIVVLWILVILSPFAYLLAFSPFGNKYSSQWWQKFSQWVTSAPVMLFFVWLSFSTLKSVTDSATFNIDDKLNVGVAVIGTTSMMASFLLGVIFLMSSLVVGQQLGGIAGKIAGGAYSYLSNKGEGAIRGSIAKTWRGAKGGADWINRKQAISKYGLPDLNIKRRWGALKAGFAEEKRKDINKIHDKADKMGQGEGLGGFALSGLYGSSNFVSERLTGILGLKGLKNAAVNTFTGGSEARRKKIDNVTEGIAKKEEEIEELNNQEKEIVTIDDYHETQENLDKEGKGAKEKIKGLDGKKEESELKMGILRDQLIKGGKNLTEERKKEINQEIDKEKEKQKEIEKEKQKETEKLSDINKRRGHLEEIKEKRGFLSEGEAESKRVAIKEQREEIISSLRVDKEKLGKIREAQGKYGVRDYEGKRARMARRREELSKIPTEESSELIEIIRGAIALNDPEQVIAALMKATQNGDLDDILKDFGYNTHTIGFTKEQRAKLERKKIEAEQSGDQEKAQAIQKEIEGGVGLHDFTREILSDRLGLGENHALEVEGDLSSIAKATGVKNLSSAVRIKGGKFYQNSSLEQMAINKIDNQKLDAEKIARNEKRYIYGGERVSDGKFIPHEAGISTVTSIFRTMNQEFGLDNKGRPRFSPMNAVKLAEDESMKILRASAVMVNEEDRADYHKMLDNLEKYAETVRGTDGDTDKEMQHLFEIKQAILSGETPPAGSPAGSPSDNTTGNANKSADSSERENNKGFDNSVNNSKDNGFTDSEFNSNGTQGSSSVGDRDSTKTTFNTNLINNIRQTIKNSGQLKGSSLTSEQLKQIENSFFNVFNIQEKKTLKKLLKSEMSKLAKQIEIADKNNDKKLLDTYKNKQETFNALEQRIKERENKEDEREYKGGSNDSSEYIDEKENNGGENTEEEMIEDIFKPE